MGTRHLIAVIKNGDYKIANYGQWDGYPSGQGREILQFLHDNDLEEFSDKLELCWFGTAEDIEKAYDDYVTKHANGFSGMDLAQSAAFAKSKFWHLSRDTGSNILQFVMSATDPVLLKDSRDFVKDSLFCEWAYIIDMDRKVFEVYKGFNKLRVPEGQRFTAFNDEAYQEAVEEHALRVKTSAERGETYYKAVFDPADVYYPVILLKEYAFGTLPDQDVFLADCEGSDEGEDDEDVSAEV